MAKKFETENGVPFHEALHEMIKAMIKESEDYSEAKLEFGNTVATITLYLEEKK